MGFVLCQVLPEERLKILRFFDKEPLKERIYVIDMVQPLSGPMQLQRSILEAHKKYGDKKNVFFIYNFEICIYLSKTSSETFFQKLNLIRDFFVGFDAAFVFFMTEASIREMIQHAFDFYDWMAITFTFVPEGLVPEELPIEIREKDEIKYSAPYEKIEYLKKSIEKTTNEKEKSLKLIELADLYYQIRDYDTSLERILKALEIDKKNSDLKHTAYDYYRIGKIYQEKGDYDAAITNYQDSLEIKEKIGDIEGAAISMAQMGNLYFQKQEYATALTLCLKSLIIFNNIGSPNAEIVKGFIAGIREKMPEEQFNAILKEFELPESFI